MKSFKSFNAHIKGLTKSWDNFLFLTLEEGREEIIKLHDILYTGMLEQFLRKDIEFIPHVGLGQFVDKNAQYDLKNPTKVPLDEPLYKQALEEAKNLNFDFTFNLNTITFAILNDTFTQITESRDFPLMQ